MPSLRDIQLILSDWSGVMSDDRPPVYESNQRLRERYDLPRISFEEWLPETKLTCHEYLASCGIAVAPDEARELYTETFRRVRGDGIHPTVYPDARAFVKGAGRDIIVVSSHPRSHLLAEADEYGLAPRIRQFIGDAHDKAAEIRQALERFRLRPHQALYMGDTVYDIQAGKAAGVVTIGVATGYHLEDRLRAESPDAVARSLSELLAWLN